MASISPIGPGDATPAQPAYNPQGPTQTRDVGSAALPDRPIASAGSVDSSPVARLQDAMVDMLQSAGLDPQSQRLMKLMIGLLILMALLESLRGGGSGAGGSGGGEAAGSPLDALAAGARGAGNGTYTGMTAIAFEQTTTTTMYMQSIEQYTAADDGANQDQLDTVA